jgi:hypothetical protein
VEAIYGNDLGTVQGKTTCRRPMRVVNNFISLPPDILQHHSKVSLSAADLMEISKVRSLLTTSCDKQFTTVEKMGGKRKHVTGSRGKLDLEMGPAQELHTKRTDPICTANFWNAASGRQILIIFAYQ